MNAAPFVALALDDYPSCPVSSPSVRVTFTGLTVPVRFAPGKNRNLELLPPCRVVFADKETPLTVPTNGWSRKQSLDAVPQLVRDTGEFAFRIQHTYAK